MKIVVLALGVMAFMAVLAALYVRFAPIEPNDWHIDPDEANAPSTPNFVLLAGDDAPVYTAAPADVFAAYNQALANLPNTSRIAVGPGEGFATYLQRTALMGYPDFISIRVTPTENGARAAIFSRSWFGRRDFGVNQARVDALFEAVAAAGLTPVQTDSSL